MLAALQPSPADAKRRTPAAQALAREIDATCRGNEITVSTTPDVKSAAVLLDSRLVDLSVPVDLTVNGKHSEVRLTPSLRTLCETLKERGDPERAFTVRAELGF